jgi:hypothetical protein
MDQALTNTAEQNSDGENTNEASAENECNSGVEEASNETGNILRIGSKEALIRSVSDDDVALAEAQLGETGSQEVLLNELKETYCRNGLTLVLGAGVSASCGAPSWTELLLKLHSKTLGNSFSGNLSGLAEIYTSAVSTDGPLISARFAAQEGGDDAIDFKEKVRVEIYRHVRENSALINELAKLSHICEGREGIGEILTYNYDVLLEEELESIGREYSRSDRHGKSDPLGIPFRHIHGFLGRQVQPDEWIVLSESSYHKEYSNPFSWSNIIQLNAFRETSCLFVGMSMTDPNQRRLLEAAKQTATPRHYCLLRRTSWKQIEESLNFEWEQRGRGSGRPTGIEKEQFEKRVRLTASLVDHSRANALIGLGVHTIWFDQHSDLPSILSALRKRK